MNNPAVKQPGYSFIITLKTNTQTNTMPMIQLFSQMLSAIGIIPAKVSK